MNPAPHPDTRTSSTWWRWSTREGRFIFVSASAERLFGYDISNVVGLDAFALFDSLSVDPVRALFHDLVARRRLSVSLEISTLRADGTPIDLDVVAVNHLDDPIGGIVVNIRDITDQKRIEQEVLESERRQATVIDSLADGVMMLDAVGDGHPGQRGVRGHVRGTADPDPGPHASPTCSSRGPAHGLALLDDDGDPLDPTDHPTMVALRTGRRSVGEVLGLHRRDGRTVWIRVNPQAMVDAGGRLAGAVSSFSDITAVRQAAAETQAARNDSSKCSWTPSKRASWPAIPTGGSPSSTPRRGGSTDWTRGPTPSATSRPTRACSAATDRP